MSEEDAEAILARGTALIELGRHEAAVALLTRAIALDPAGSARAHCLMAKAFLALGRPADALDAAGRAASSTPEWEWPHRLAAIALLRLGRRGEALQAAEESCRLAPSEPNALAVLSEARLARRDLAGAEQAAREAIRLAPDSVVGHDALALWALDARRPAEAEAACRRSLAIDPQDSVSMNNLGVAQLRRFHVLRALRTYSAALQLDPTHDLPQTNLRRFFRSVFILVGTAAFVALVNVGDWVKGFSHLSPGGQLVAAVAVAAGVLAVGRAGPALARWLPAPAVVVARDVISFRPSRRLTPGGVRAAWIWVAVSAFFVLSAVSLVVDPVEADDRSNGLVMGALALTACALALWRLIGHHQSGDRAGIKGAAAAGLAAGRRLAGSSRALVRDVRSFRPPRRLTTRGLWGVWIGLAVSAVVVLGSLSLVFDPVQPDDRTYGLGMGLLALAACALAVRRLIRHRRARRP